MDWTIHVLTATGQVSVALALLVLWIGPPAYLLIEKGRPSQALATLLATTCVTLGTLRWVME